MGQTSMRGSTLLGRLNAPSFGTPSRGDGSLRQIISLAPRYSQTCTPGHCGAACLSAATANAPGLEVPLHRSLTEPILLGGAPRAVAIANGTLAAAVGLGLQLWPPGVALWVIGHSLAVWGARLDPQFMPVFARHIKHRVLLDV